MNTHRRQGRGRHWMFLPPEESERILRGKRLERVFETLRDGGLPCDLRRPDRDERLPGRLVDLADKTLVFEARLPEPSPFRPWFELLVSFELEGRGYSFPALLRRLRHEDGVARLELVRPFRAASGDVRRALRIPMTWCDDFQADLQWDGRVRRCEVLDISLGGFLAVTADGEPAALEKVDALRVRFRLGVVEALLDARVTSRRDGRLGFSFTGFDAGRPEDAPEDFRSLLLAIAKAWERQRPAGSPSDGEAADLQPWLDGPRILR